MFLLRLRTKSEGIFPFESASREMPHRPRVPAWPKLIGSGVGLIGLGLLLSAAGRYLPSLFVSEPFARHPADGLLQLIAGVIALTLSFFLYRAHNWARRALFCLSVALLACATVLFVFLAAWLKTTYDGPESAFPAEVIADMHRQELFTRLEQISPWLCGVALLGSITLALLHPDVAQAFQRRAPSDNPFSDASNS